MIRYACVLSPIFKLLGAIDPACPQKEGANRTLMFDYLGGLPTFWSL